MSYINSIGFEMFFFIDYNIKNALIGNDISFYMSLILPLQKKERWKKEKKKKPRKKEKKKTKKMQLLT